MVEPPRRDVPRRCRLRRSRCASRSDRGEAARCGRTTARPTELIRFSACRRRRQRAGTCIARDLHGVDRPASALAQRRRCGAQSRCELPCAESTANVAPTHRRLIRQAAPSRQRDACGVTCVTDDALAALKLARLTGPCHSADALVARSCSPIPRTLPGNRFTVPIIQVGSTTWRLIAKPVSILRQLSSDRPSAPSSSHLSKQPSSTRKEP